MSKKRKKQTAEIQSREMRSSLLAWLIILAPLSVALFLLVFGDQIPFLREQSSQEARVAAENLWRFGQEKMRQGDYQNANFYFTKALKIKPNLAEAYISIAQIFFLNGKVDEAIATLNQALALNPPQKELAMNNLGLLYARKGDFDKALEIFQKALKVGIIDEQVCGNLGTVYMNLGKFPQAIEMYRSALKSEPTMQSRYREMLYKVIREYEDETEYASAWQSAEEQYQKGVPPEYYLAYDSDSIKEYARIQSQKASLLFRLGFALEMNGDLSQAESTYLQSLKLNPASLETNYRLGCLYMKLNQPTLARQYLQTTLRLNRYHREAASLLTQLP
jgi:tetratricopeptide (TPR) repeat protein